MAAFFARVKHEEGHRDARRNNPTDAGRPRSSTSVRAGEVTQPRTGKVMAPKFLGGAAPTIPPGKDRREVLADWLTGPTNPFFAKSVVNRVWYHLIGQGIVDPVDDFRDSNPPANDELLDALAKDFVGQQVRPEAPDPHDHELADVPAQRPAERLRTRTTPSTSRTP